MKPAERIKMLENRLAELNTQLEAYKDEVKTIKEGGTKMRVWRGKTLAEKHQAAQDKKHTGKKAAPLTAAQRQKIKELQKRIEDENSARLNPVPKGAEIRGYCR